LFFRRRAAHLDRLLQGQEVLAHWKYTAVEWQAYIDAELSEQTRENRALWLVMAGMCLFVGALFCLFDREAGFYVLLVMVGMTGILAAAAFGLPRLRRRRRRRQGHPGEVWLAPTAVYFDGVFLPWNSWEARLQKVDLQAASGSAPACLRFHLVHIVKTGIQVSTLRIPVPAGRLEEASALLGCFKTKSR
jgi:hypothetical protein